MTVKINKRKTLHTGRTFDFVLENVTLTNGATVDLEMVRHPGAAAIVPFIDHDTLILIKQYRHAIGDFIWEIPAGTLDAKEAAIECAKRELIEETGYSANGWEELGKITPVPGYSDELIYIFLATELAEAQQNLDRDEVLNVHRVKLPDAVDMIRSGQIQDCKTICGIFFTLNKLGGIHLG
ncbi:MAG: NUDIX hydrolase [Deltaproteobacteria bacterium]|nr:NUDIX hydrolase [Deltaproteobacteria bacterium]